MIKVDIRSKHSAYITIGKWVIYVDNSTGEQIIESWKECMLTAHKESINLLNAQPPGYVDENGLYIKFYCDKLV